MIIDQIILAGADAYVRGEGAAGVNLATVPSVSTPEGPVRVGRSIVPGEGTVVQVRGIELYLEHEALRDAFARRGAPLLAVRVNKEMFPGLWADPYAHRVHRVSGFEDFSRGASHGFRVMEVDGVACLVSTGAQEERWWRSAIYPVGAPAAFVSAAWDVPSARLLPPSAFRYDLSLRWWSTTDTGRAGQVCKLATQATADQPRRCAALDPAVAGARAYQLELHAWIERDAFMQERYAGSPSTESLGRPLLTAIHLLEAVPSAHHYHSVRELISSSSRYELLDEAGGPAQRLIARLAFSAVLARGESISLELPGNETPLRRVEARLDASVLVRPPPT